MNFRTTALLLASLFILAFASCHKTTPTPPPHITYGLAATSGASFYEANYTYTFSSDAPAGSTVQWSFGDGSTSTELAPTHTYTSLGTYTVTLAVNGNTASIKLVISRTTIPHAIYCTNPWIKDYALRFSSNVLPDSTFLWEFGDGSTSTDSTPSHTYTTAGSYTVKLTINDNTTQAFSTTVYIVTPPAHTAAMGGDRIWHDTSYLYLSGPPNVYPKPNQTFAINVINPVTIQFQGRTLNYSRTMSSDSADIFFSSYTDPNYRDHSITASYYYYFDSIEVYSYDQASTGHGISHEKWTTP